MQNSLQFKNRKEFFIVRSLLESMLMNRERPS